MYGKSPYRGNHVQDMRSPAPTLSRCCTTEKYDITTFRHDQKTRDLRGLSVINQALIGIRTYNSHRHKQYVQTGSSRYR